MASEVENKPYIRVITIQHIVNSFHKTSRKKKEEDKFDISKGKEKAIWENFLKLLRFYSIIHL